MYLQCKKYKQYNNFKDEKQKNPQQQARSI